MAKNKGYPSNLLIKLPPFWTKLVQISDLFGCRSASKIHDPWRLLISICHWYRRKVDTKILKSCVFPKSEHSKWRRRHQNNRFVVKKKCKNVNFLVFIVSNRQIWRHLALFSLCDFLHSALEKAIQTQHFCEKFPVFCTDFARRINITKNVFYNWIKLSKQFCTLKSIKKVTFLHFLLKHSHAARKLCFSMPRIPDYAFIMLQTKLYSLSEKFDL